jgi:hypothetical protein
MPTNDRSDLAHHMSPVFADQTDEPELGDAYKRALASEAARTSSRVSKASVLIAIVTATGIAALFITDPVTVVTNVTASLVGNSVPQPGIQQPPPIAQPAADAPALPQSVADAQDLSPAAKDAPKDDAKDDAKSDPKSDEVAAAEPAAARDQMEKSEPPPDALFRQFQAWAADQDAQTMARPEQPAQDAPAQLGQDAPAREVEHAEVRHRAVQKHRQAPTVHNARAETPTQNIRRVRRVQSARAERPPVQDARAQDRSVQSAPVQTAPVQTAPAQTTQTPSFLSAFGQRN